MKPIYCLPAVLTAAALAGHMTARAADETPQRPNVILLVADDLGYGDLECYGAKNIETPNVNRLANEGIRFTQVHCTASTSTPSRYSLLTGEYAWRRSDTGVVPGDAAQVIKSDQYTMADMFHDAGYFTGAIGKWHLGLGDVAGKQNWNGVLSGTPRDLGFDYHYIQAATADRVPCVYLEQDTIANYDPSAPISVSYSANFPGEPTGVDHRDELLLDWTHGHNNSIINGISRIGFMKGGGTALWKDENIADSIADHTRRFVLEHAQEPFFLYLCTNDVHVPRWPHERFRGKNPMGLRGDAIASFDWTVGKVMDALEEAGIADNTLIIVTSDNGPILDDGYADQAVELLNGHSPTAGYRGDKYSGFEGGTMAPFIVRWPARVKPQAEPNPTLMSHIDLFGSFGALIGATIPKGAAPDSGDMIAQILGESMEHRPWVSELSQNRTICIRTPEWKFIGKTNRTGALSWAAIGWQGAVDTGDRTVDQLYDMVNDPHETTNVAAQRPEIVADMLKVYEAATYTPFDEPLASTADEEHWYTLCTPNRSNYTLSLTKTGLYGVSPDEATFARCQWKFTKREDGTYNFINRSTGQYINPGSVTGTSQQLKVSDTEPAKGWRFDYGTASGTVIITTEDKSVQLNQTTSANNYKIYNWGGGNRDDAGCQFRFTEFEGEPEEEIAIPTKYAEPLAGTADAPRYYVIRNARANQLLRCEDSGLMTGVSTKALNSRLVWRLDDRGDGTFDIVCLFNNRYITPYRLNGTGNKLTSSFEQPAQGWTITSVGASKYIIVCGTEQLNQGDESNGYNILSWGDGTNTSNTGCRFSFSEVTDLTSRLGVTLPEADATAREGIYDLFGRRVSNPSHGIYIVNGRKVIL